VKNYPLPHNADEETRACILTLVNVDGELSIPASHFDFTNNEVAYAAKKYANYRTCRMR
jgi:hypothetical protein